MQTIEPTAIQILSLWLLTADRLSRPDTGPAHHTHNTRCKVWTTTDWSRARFRPNTTIQSYTGWLLTLSFNHNFFIARPMFLWKHRTGSTSWPKIARQATETVAWQGDWMVRKYITENSWRQVDISIFQYKVAYMSKRVWHVDADDVAVDWRTSVGELFVSWLCRGRYGLLLSVCSWLTLCSHSCCMCQDVHGNTLSCTALFVVIFVCCFEAIYVRNCHC